MSPAFIRGQIPPPTMPTKQSWLDDKANPLIDTYVHHKFQIGTKDNEGNEE